MALIVDGQNGNDSWAGTDKQPLKTLGKAYSVSGNGDTIKVRTAVYREELTLGKNGQTWEADKGHKPRLDGGYGPFTSERKGSEYNLKGGQLPGANRQSLLKFSGDNNTWDGIDVKHVGGVGVAFTSGATGNTLKNCEVYHCYAASIIVDGGADGTTIDNVVCDKASLKAWATGGDGAGQTQTQLVVQAKNVTVTDTTVMRSLGEGFSAAKGSENVVFRRCKAFDTAHSGAYWNRAKNPTFDSCLIMMVGGTPYSGKSPSGGLTIRDENAGKSYPHSSGGKVINCIFVGCSEGIRVTANQPPSSNHGNTTALQGAYIGHNTLVNCRSGVRFDEQSGLPYKNSVFENNIIVGKDMGKSGLNSGGLQFRSNIWHGAAAPARFRSNSDSTADPNLANPNAKVNENTSADNYKLTSKSANAIDRAFGNEVDKDHFGAKRGAKRDIGAHEFGGVPDPEPDPEPLPPPPDPEPEPEPPAAGQARIWLEAGWYDVQVCGE